MIAVDSLNKSIIQDSLQNHKEALDTFGVLSLYIFGSVARNEANSKSDIDFLVTFKDGRKNFDNFMNLTFLLEDLFRVKIDLLTSVSISESFKNSIKKESIQIEI